MMMMNSNPTVTYFTCTIELLNTPCDSFMFGVLGYIFMLPYPVSMYTNKMKHIIKSTNHSNEKK